MHKKMRGEERGKDDTGAKWSSLRSVPRVLSLHGEKKREDPGNQVGNAGAQNVKRVIQRMSDTQEQKKRKKYTMRIISGSARALMFRFAFSISVIKKGEFFFLVSTSRRN